MAGLEIPEDLDFTKLDQKQKVIMLDKLFFKILATDTDLDFQENLFNYLPKLIDKLATNDEIVRKKLMEILVHINKRVKSRPNVQLPIYELLNQFNQASSNNLTFVTNFSLIYIKLSYPRLDAKQKAEMIEHLLKCLDGKSPPQQDSLLALVVDGLKCLELNVNDSINVVKYGLNDMPKIRKYFLDYLLNYLLLPYELPTTTNATKPIQQQQQASNANESTNTPPQAQAQPPPTSEIPACLSEKLYKQFKSDVNLENVDELERSKVAILKFLSLNIYKNEDVLFHFIIATSDTRYNVVRVAELHIKRITSVDWNDQTIVTKIYQLFMGDKTQKKPTQQKSDFIIEPANTRIRLKLYPYILRSRLASNTIPQSLQIVFDCLFGTVNTNKKIKHYTVQFVHNIATNCDVDKLLKIGAVLVQGLNKLIAEAKDDGKLRGLAYIAIGKFARRIPNVISNDITLVHNFFNALALEDLDTKLNIQEALVLMIEAFRDANNEQKSSLLKMLFQYVENDVPQCRAMSIKYAFEIFDNDHLESRYLLILAASDNKEDIRQEATKYLHKTHDYDENELKIAKFEELVMFITSKVDERLKQNSNVYVIGTRTIAFDVKSYFEALVLMRLSLSKSANLKPQVIDLKSIDTIKDETPQLVKYLDELANRNINVLYKYINLIKEYAIVVGNSLGIYLLLEICAISPFNVTKNLIEDIEWIKSLAFSVNEEIRFYAAELWSIVLINSIINDKLKNFDYLFSILINLKKTNLDNPNKSFEQKHGTLLCIGYAIGKYYSQINEFKSKYINELKDLIECVSSYLDDNALSYAAIVSFGEIARNGQLLFDNEKLVKIIEQLQRKILTSNEVTKLKERVALTLSYMCVGVDDTITNEFDLNKLIMQKLLDSAQIKQIELHMTLGESLINCALGKKSTAIRNYWLYSETDWLKKHYQDANSTNKHLNWLLNQLLDNYIDNKNPHLRQAAAFWLLILLKKCFNIDSYIQKCLLRIQDAFIMRLSESDEITQEVASKAIGLIYSLANDEQKNNLVSKLSDTLSGGTAKKQATSAAALQTNIKIHDENEEIFKQEQIGKTPDGANISTYKELCSLASDLNQPDLIYRFMNLASHNSMWNTRRGAAFGFSTIANLASNELQKYLPVLVPKLYRYQFDPNPKIQQSMQSIWNSIIKQDNKKILDQYLDLILVDIEQNMLSNLWRVRESCCLALCDLFKGGRNLEAISAKFGVFWSLLFKLIDDIKESVRLAAELALKSLNRVTIAYSSAVSSLTVCENTIKGVIPILIQDGLNSKLDQVRDITVKTILELTKQSQSSEYLKPYLIDLIPNLLESLSGYEPSDLNYLSLKLNSLDLQEKLDIARINASKNTPMVEIINLNIKYIDADLLSNLLPKLIELIKRGLGVSTKAGLCNLISTLIDQSPNVIAPYAGKLMAAFVNAISVEINKTIRKCYCNTLGSIVKIAKESSIENLLNKLKEWYFEKDDDGIKLSCGLTLLAISHNNSELLTKYSKLCAPFIFFAMHQQTEKTSSSNGGYAGDAAKLNDTSSVWENVWDECTSGTEYAIKSNLGEILNIIKVGIEHQSWKLRIQSAMTMCTIFNKLQSKVDVSYVDEILIILNNALNTRTWSGKEKVLIAISSLFNNCKLILKIENELLINLIKNVFKEASKQSSNINLNYKIHTLRCLADILQFSSTNSIDNDFETYWSLFIESYFKQNIENLKQLEEEIRIKKFEKQEEINKEQQNEDEKMQDNNENANDGAKKVKLSNENNVKNEDNDENSDDTFSNVRLICLESMGKCWPYTTEMQEKYVKTVSYLLSDSLNKVTWTNQMAIVKSLLQIFEKWTIEINEKNIEIVLISINLCVTSVTNCIAKTKYSNLKRDGLDLLDKIMNILIHESTNNVKWLNLIENTYEASQFKSITESMRILFEEFNADSNIDIKEKSKQLLKLFNSKF